MVQINFTKPSSYFVLPLVIVGLILTIGLMTLVQAEAQTLDPQKDVSVEMLASATGITQGETIEIAVIFKVPNDYHITSLETGLFYVDFQPVDGLEFGEPLFPPAVDFQGDDVFQGEVIVRTSVTATDNVNPGSILINASAGYQVCVETGSQQCFFPVEKELTIDTEILPKGTAPQLINEDIFSTDEAAFEEISSPESTPRSEGLAGSVESALARGSLLALFLVFLGGILTSFTPCIYPIIPITVSFIGAHAGGSKLQGFFLSLFFVLGLGIMYSSLGVIAALSGGVFGGLTQHPAVYGFMIIIFLVMGASMMGAFDIQLPASWQGKLQSGKRKGVVGAILMGMAAGLIAAPCVGPVLVALLSWVARTGSVIIGFGLLFTFSMGLGMLFIVIGTFAGAVSSLPQSGGWMDGVKHFFGWLLWGTAVYFASVIIPQSYFHLILGAFFCLLGIYLGAFRPTDGTSGWNWMLRKWIGILAMIVGIFFFIFGLTQVAGWHLPSAPSNVETVQSEPDWIINDVDGAFTKAEAQGKPMMMDFYADWCVACVELDHKTYNQPEVLALSRQFINLKMDFTTQNEWTRKMTADYRVMGMPTVIFFSPQGDELERFVGYKNSVGVAAIMERVISEN
ncbi:hypothetical protein CEE37_08020 [candidate division LCP-89 bacterium B3_LCP]|uniref:Thioredoxin domain-containing protein n=1 Tax=candidate division LCP-89 bacterium B3_LCP TaxID=2012998 RepID=A0A532UZ76_UNCL8|nr:MAG: hypothetical protein CEE37_08020 [candidate division LCP-89 bacterium B3_LCP]